MNIIFILLFLILFSCNYPDIDTVPEFNSMDLTKEENLDKCKMLNSNNFIKEECYSELNKINNRL